MRVCMIYGVVVSALALGLLWFGAPIIGTKVLGDARTVVSMKVLAAALHLWRFRAVYGDIFSQHGSMED